MRVRLRWWLSVSAMAMVGAIAAPPAHAYIYWGGDYYHVGVGRAELDGTAVNTDFIPAPAGSYAYIKGVASDGKHLYYGVHGKDTSPSYSFSAPQTWRANPDGTGQQFFVQGTSQTTTSLTVTPTHVLWTGISQDTSSVGFVPIGGGQFGAIESTFGQVNPRTCGVAADDQYIYFANLSTSSIGRAELANAGTANQVVDTEWIKLPQGQQPCGVAVDGDSIYWGTFREPKVSANDYDGPNGKYVYRADKATGTGVQAISSEGNAVTGVAVLGDFVYFSNHPDFLKTGSIKRTGTKGGGTVTLVSGLEATWGVAVDDGGVKPAPPAAPVYPTPYQAPIDLPAVYCDGCTGGTAATAPPYPAVRPDFSKVFYSKKSFKAAQWNTPLMGPSVYVPASGARASAARAAATPRATSGPGGTTFTYVLGQDATMKIALNSVAPGKTKGTTCLRPTRKLRKAKKCDLLKLVNTLTRTSKAGTNAVAFSGRINDQAFKPGKYRAVFTPSIGALAADARSLDFTIAK